MKVPHLSLVTFTLLLIQLSGYASGGKILVFPLDGSHWVNMKVLIEELHDKGHEITVVRASDSWYISEKSPFYTSVNLPNPSGFKENLSTFLSPQLEMRLQSKPSSFWSHIWTQIQRERMVFEQVSQFHKTMSEMIVQMFEDENLMRSFHNAKYDVVLTDPSIGGGTMLARQLQVPLVFNVRWTIQGAHRGGRGREGEGSQSASPWRPETVGGVTLPSPPKRTSRWPEDVPERAGAEPMSYSVLWHETQRAVFKLCPKAFEETEWTADTPLPRGKGRHLLHPWSNRYWSLFRAHQGLPLWWTSSNSTVCYSIKDSYLG
eukprot:superscaffoldBa00002839_g15430